MSSRLFLFIFLLDFAMDSIFLWNSLPPTPRRWLLSSSTTYSDISILLKYASLFGILSDCCLSWPLEPLLSLDLPYTSIFFLIYTLFVHHLYINLCDDYSLDGHHNCQHLGYELRYLYLWAERLCMPRSSTHVSSSLSGSSTRHEFLMVCKKTFNNRLTSMPLLLSICHIIFCWCSSLEHQVFSMACLVLCSLNYLGPSVSLLCCVLLPRELPSCQQNYRHLFHEDHLFWYQLLRWLIMGNTWLYLKNQ